MSTTLKYTPVEDIPPIVAKGKQFYRDKQLKLSHEKNPRKVDLQFRIRQLQKLYYSIKDHQDDIIDAMMKDFHRAPQETFSLELIPLINDILLMIKRLPEWLKPTKITDHAPPFMFGKVQVERIARGLSLVIAPFNFPLLLALTPVANAIAGGNSVILKPSELTPHVAQLMEDIIKDADLPDGLIHFVQGGIPETTKLLEDKNIDMIFYTGSPRVGSIVATAAGKHLIPCVLELGGKSPVFITENFNMSNLKTALNRLFFGGFANSGQLCVRPDYILIHESHYDQFIQQSKLILNKLFPELNKDTEFTHMISKSAYERTMQKLENTKGHPFFPQSFINTQDETKERNLLIPPTLICDIDWDDSIMVEENFAPIIPILKYHDLDEVIDKVIKYHDTPLVQYIFSDSQDDINHILSRVRSGDCVINETIIHVGIQEAPFGGIGFSGYGNYGGKHGFDAFTHERTIFKQPFWMDFALSMRYFPYSTKKTKLATLATENKPDFTRNGKKKFTACMKFCNLMCVLALLLAYFYYIHYDGNNCSPYSFLKGRASFYLVNP